LGTASLVNDTEEKLKALYAISEHILPGRWAEARQPNEKELKATSVIRLPIQEFSAKVRTGPPIDDEEDYSFPVWAGVMPLATTTGRPVPDKQVELAIPDYVQKYSRPRK
jgi:hypothetical protein